MPRSNFLGRESIGNDEVEPDELREDSIRRIGGSPPPSLPAYAYAPEVPRDVNAPAQRTGRRHLIDGELVYEWDGDETPMATPHADRIGSKAWNP